MSTQVTTPTPPALPTVLCMDCDEPITAKRLAAIHDARYCINCQPAHDRPLREEILTDPETMRELAQEVLGTWGS